MHFSVLPNFPIWLVLIKKKLIIMFRTVYWTEKLNAIRNQRCTPGDIESENLDVTIGFYF